MYILFSGQGVQLSGNVPFVIFEWLVWELPADNQRVSDSVFKVKRIIYVVRSIWIRDHTCKLVNNRTFAQLKTLWWLTAKPRSAVATGLMTVLWCQKVATMSAGLIRPHLQTQLLLTKPLPPPPPLHPYQTTGGRSKCVRVKPSTKT